MSPLEVLRFAVKGLLANKMRSVLTTLGISIGVAAVILLTAVGNGASKAIENSIAGLGTNLLTVSPMRGGAVTAPRPLTVADAEALADKRIAPDVRSVSPVVSAQATATYRGLSHSVGQVIGTRPSYFDATSSPVGSGAAFSDSDVADARKVVVIGQTVAQELFAGDDPLGKQIQLNNIPFTVAGVLAQKGSSGLQNADDTVVAPLTTLQYALTGTGSLNQVVVQAESAEVITAAQNQITAVLNQRHGITGSSTSDFRVQNQQQLLSTRTQAVDVFTTLLAAVAGISLLVGGIGITNIMLVTVTERIREIGIRKAIGAPRGAISGQFLAEATLLSMIGGAIGVLAGWVGSRFSFSGIQPEVLPSSVLLAFGVSVLIGLFFGSYPASRAARLRPIEALRHE
ncbi:ABC transporter permease [Allokutzneria sp. NRRL B-24872]|uniref:ABC transporter permease n=1 Tax=Allokutzneria sp. NRRL B-24872 TaxID=1137961 RepID=UPI000A3C2458|nr:ABC transporter permease [Allokutzneria sp. NRRL B-24872]